jgi:UDP-glucose 4-epimerase
MCKKSWTAGVTLNNGRKVLVTGGAGYIGSHVARELVDRGFDVTVIDLLREKFGTGNRWAVPAKARFVQGDCGDRALLKRLLPSGQRFDAVFHFAAYILVEESVREPKRYFQNNVEGSRALFDYAFETGVPAVIFSSTAATYGEPQSALINETDPQRPVNPYGESKLQAEKILKEIADRYSSRSLNLASKTGYVGLRYFNPAGAHESLEIGQARPEATHLVNVAAEAAIGKRSAVMIFGDDYPTSDGTCLRDYIHIQDLSDAHIKALEYLDRGGASDFFNVGYGKPYSVREVLESMMRVTGKNFSVELRGRRVGDPAQLAADSAKIKAAMGWQPTRDSLDEICRSQFLWEKKRL